MQLQLTICLALFAADALCGATVIEPPKSFTPKKKPPKTIQIEILKPAENCTVRVQKGDQVEISFHLFLFSSEKEVDYTEPDEAYSFRVGYGESIEGLDQGIIGMCVNETRRMIIPSYLAYGTRGATVIVPPGASIILDVTLISLFPMEFDEKRLERVQQTKLVYDKRQKDSHYMGHGSDFWYPKYKRQKPRDEEEEEKRRDEEKLRKAQEEDERRKKEEEAAIEEELKKTLAEMKNKGSNTETTTESALRNKIALRRKKQKKATIKGFSAVEQVRQEIAERKRIEREEEEKKQKEEEERVHKTPSGFRFRGMPRPSRLKSLMHAPPRSQDNREERKKEFQKRQRNLNEKREIGRERKKHWIEEHFKPQLTEEQKKQLEEEQRLKAEEEARKKKVESVKDAILKGGKKKSEKEPKKSESENKKEIKDDL
ncbi:putative FK506-binding protein 2B [Monocercomonoides exilis]|uniref:putative FK506-binding protein 2B n=1 Tax=Monocercomonoides exilis TaxID=2049356 RepID=UPI00355A1A10|nr:putative FK506-binding protein 2B [Monocercomonoides exilis]|eukprot:MONOS_1680.1-p1 / transcript=MONOS_1680.1 / gene=MONOS_1680 / organism=Monocercomonoides_exilis_PA203 / gene_product=RecName / transcript_product=RecName / location=Mono_scaffold00031:67511-69091(-) / protein_length=428 / sequence_SO=supercontig / SO=protein_coding / is_pseudo=false